jgi:acetyl esterase/lipase
MTVWKTLTKTTSPKKMAVFGNSAGGALSPLFGDLKGFPPTILTTGTRDLLLSSTVLVHRKMRQAGVDAVLQVFEGLSHAQFNKDPEAPETKDAFGQIAQFFDKHLGR